MKLTEKITPRGRGILCVIAAAFGFSLMSVFVRLAGENLPSTQKAFFRNFVALLFVGVTMARNKVSLMPARKNIPLLLCRSVFGTVGILCNFYAIDHLVLADANMLNKLSPFFAIVFSFFLLGEKPSLVQLLGLLMALAGSACIIKPGFAGAAPLPAALGLLGGMSAGLAYTFVRKLGTRGEAGPRIIFFFSAFSCLGCLPFMAVGYVPMTGKQLVFLILAGISAAIGQFGITKAYVFAPAKEISVYDYTQVIFAALLGFFLFQQLPDAWSVLGYVLICGAGVGMFLYNRKTDRRRQ